MKKIFKKVIFSVLILASVFFSASLFAGVGGGSPNPTGGFGTSGTGEDPNPTGSFGSQDGFDVLQAPPPPPPTLIPIDGGSLILVISGIAAGAGTMLRKSRR